jgi:hypothetical protein
MQEDIRILSYPDFEELYIKGKLVVEGSRIDLKEMLEEITKTFGITTKFLTINNDIGVN